MARLWLLVFALAFSLGAGQGVTLKHGPSGASLSNPLTSDLDLGSQLIFGDGSFQIDATTFSSLAPLYGLAGDSYLAPSQYFYRDTVGGTPPDNKYGLGIDCEHEGASSYRQTSKTTHGCLDASFVKIGMGEGEGQTFRTIGGGAGDVVGIFTSVSAGSMIRHQSDEGYVAGRFQARDYFTETPFGTGLTIASGSPTPVTFGGMTVGELSAIGIGNLAILDPGTPLASLNIDTYDAGTRISTWDTEADINATVETSGVDTCMCVVSDAHSDGIGNTVESCMFVDADQGSKSVSTQHYAASLIGAPAGSPLTQQQFPVAVEFYACARVSDVAIDPNRDGIITDSTISFADPDVSSFDPWVPGNWTGNVTNVDFHIVPTPGDEMFGVHALVDTRNRTTNVDAIRATCARGHASSAVCDAALSTTSDFESGTEFQMTNDTWTDGAHFARAGIGFQESQFHSKYWITPDGGSPLAWSRLAVLCEVFDQNCLSLAFDLDDAFIGVGATEATTRSFISAAQSGGSSGDVLLYGGGNVMTDWAYTDVATEAELDLKSAASSTNNNVARFDGTSGDIQDSGVIVSDTNDVIVPGTLTAIGNLAATADATVTGNLIVSGDFQAKARIVDKPSGGNLALTDVLGAIVTNCGASGGVTFTLPNAVEGYCTTAYVCAAQTITLDPQGASGCTLGATCDQIISDTNSPGKYVLSSATVGSKYTVCALDADTWAPMGTQGAAWTQEP